MRRDLAREKIYFSPLTMTTFSFTSSSFKSDIRALWTTTTCQIRHFIFFSKMPLRLLKNYHLKKKNENYEKIKQKGEKLKIPKRVAFFILAP